MNFSRKEGRQNIQPSTKPGIELGTSGLGGRDLNHMRQPLRYVLPTRETHGDTGSVHPKRSQEAALQHVKQKKISILALLSGIVLGGQTQSLREFQEWAIALRTFTKDFSQKF